jgi:hypothetical protein
VPQVVVEVAAKELNGVDAGRVVTDFRTSFENDPIMASAKAHILARKSQDSAQRVGIVVDLVKPEADKPEVNKPDDKKPREGK